MFFLLWPIVFIGIHFKGISAQIASSCGVTRACRREPPAPPISILIISFVLLPIAFFCLTEKLCHFGSLPTVFGTSFRSDILSWKQAEKAPPRLTVGA